MTVTEDTATMLTHALQWAQRGTPIIPLHNPVEGRCSCGNPDCPSPAKHPRTPNGLKDASSDPATITEWWTRWPDANIGVLTGYDFDVIDLDGKDAIKAWREFVNRIGQTPDTIGIAASGRTTGGIHLYTNGGGQKTVPSGKRGLPPGVEIKGVGGYVVAPGSRHMSGATYQWLADFGTINGDTYWADWYANHITPNPTPTTGTPFLPPPDSGADSSYGRGVLRNACERLATTPPGGRHDALVTDAASSIARAINGGAITDIDNAVAQLQAAAQACGLTPAEIGKIPALLRKFVTNGSTKPLSGDGREQPAPLASFTTPKSDTSDTAGDDTDGDDSEEQRTSWWPQPLTGDEHEQESPPEHLRRNDGHALFYPGRVNGILGESESGKTWVALAAVKQATDNGQHCLIIDFEDTRSGVMQRLRALGCTDRHLQHIHYIAPEESLHPAASADITEHLTKHPSALSVIDGVNAAMTLMGYEVNSNTDATAFAQKLLKPLAATGSAVVYVDHVPKSKENRGKGGIGAQAKRAMTTGCTILADVIEQPGPGRIGKLRLTVDKDRPGRVRENCRDAKGAGIAIIDGSEDGKVKVTIEAPDLRPAEQRGHFRPTVAMQAVSNLLTNADGPLSKNAIESALNMRRDTVRTAIQTLAEEGYVALTNGTRGSLMVTQISEYNDTLQAFQP